MRTAALFCVFALTNSVGAQGNRCRDILDVVSDPARIERRAFVREFELTLRAMFQKYPAGVIETRLLGSTIHRVHFVPDPLPKKWSLPFWFKRTRAAPEPVEKDYVLLMRKSLEFSGETLLLFDPETKLRVGVLPTGRFEFLDGRVLYAWWSYPDGHQYKWLPHHEAFENFVERL